MERKLAASKTGRRKMTRAGPGPGTVVCIHHLPHGLYEKQLRGFLDQFGSVLNLKVGRSPKTGGSRGYAFVQFKYPEVAKIVSETINNYLMFEKLIKCEVVADSKTRRGLFRGKVNPEFPPGLKRRREAKQVLNKARSDQEEAARRKNQLRGLRKKVDKLKELGINLQINLPVQGSSSSKPSTPDVAEVTKKAKKLRRHSEGAVGKKPTMEVDDSDGDITLKTPPNVRKINRKSSSAAKPRRR